MLKFFKTIFVAGLLAGTAPVAAFEIGDMTDLEKDQFGEQVREYLVQNPEVIMQALRELERRQQTAELQADEAMVAAYLDEIQNDGFSWEGGNPDGDIVLVEFMDYRCGYCRKAHKQVNDLIKTDGNIRLVIKEYPILGEESTNSSIVAIATLQSLGPDAYEKMYDELMVFNGPVNEKSIRFLSKKLGLDADVIITAMDAPSVLGHIQKTRQLGEQLRISGTPTFVFNDQIVRGYIPEDAMKQIVAELRATTD
jgi:protein-disulfide isomerase